MRRRRRPSQIMRSTYELRTRAAFALVASGMALAAGGCSDDKTANGIDGGVHAGATGGVNNAGAGGTSSSSGGTAGHASGGTGGYAHGGGGAGGLASGGAAGHSGAAHTDAGPMRDAGLR